MTTAHEPLASIPAERRGSIGDAIRTVFGSAPISTLQPVGGGASGALIYRFEIGGAAYLLRAETRRDALRNPHQYTCMQIAADAGIAPRLLHADAVSGIAIMAFIASRPLSEFPGGAGGLAHAFGTLIARLQEAATFPELADYPALVERMLRYLRASGTFQPALLDPHQEAFERIRTAYPWNASTRTSSHNDPGVRNVLFDGERLWLIDWETAYRNDPLIDLAIVADNVAPTPDLETMLLRAWSGQEPTRSLQARLALLRPFTRLYYAGLIFTVVAGGPPAEPYADVTAPSPAEFRAALSDGRLKPGTPDMMRTLGKMLLAGFLSGASGPAFENALAVVRAE